MPLMKINDQPDYFATPTKSQIKSHPFQTPVKKGRHLGSQLLQDWYNGSQVSDFIGDQNVHALVFDRLTSLQVVHCQVLMDIQEEELITAWNNSSLGSQTDLCGPGIARSFVSQLRSCLLQSVQSAVDPGVAHPASPLASALAHMAAAAGTFKRRRRSYDHDLGSSEEESQFNLSTVLHNYRSKYGYLKLVPSSAFGDLRRLNQLKSKADKRSDHQVPFMALSPIEDWFPRWIGADLDRDKRSALRKARAKDLSSKGFASFLSNILTFLLSHLAVGQIELPSILAYVVVLCKVSEERGSNSAMRYHYLLHNHISDRIRVGERFRLDQYFSSELDHIIRKLESRQPQVHLTAPPPLRERPAPRRPLPVTKPEPSRGGPKELVCFKHRPRENQKCQDSSCLKSKEHLDTNQPDLLARWTKAHQAFERSKKPSNTRR